VFDELDKVDVDRAIAHGSAAEAYGTGADISSRIVLSKVCALAQSSGDRAPLAEMAALP